MAAQVFGIMGFWQRNLARFKAYLNSHAAIESMSAFGNSFSQNRRLFLLERGCGQRLRFSSSVAYSCLSAMPGSTFVARRAGTAQAAIATANSISGITANVIGSVALTP
jgi:hypothetical protein